MIGLPASTEIWIAAGVTDLRRGFTGLSAIAQTVLEKSPFSGHVFVFRGRRGDLIKLLWFDGDGLCLFAKRLERGRFVWPTRSWRSRGRAARTPSPPPEDAAVTSSVASGGTGKRSATTRGLWNPSSGSV